MTKHEFMFEHSLDTTVDLILRDLKRFTQQQEAGSSQEPLPVMQAGDFL